MRSSGWVDQVDKGSLNNSNTNTHVPVSNHQKKAVGHFVLFLTRVKRGDKGKRMKGLSEFRNKGKVVKS